MQSSSANCPSDIKEEFFNSGIMDAVEASINSSGDKRITPSSVDLMVAPFGIMKPGSLTDLFPIRFVCLESASNHLLLCYRLSK